MNVEQVVEWELAEEPKYSEKTHPSTTLSTTNAPQPDLDQTYATLGLLLISYS
jgi:hypothetical protein